MGLHAFSIQKKLQIPLVRTAAYAAAGAATTFLTLEGRAPLAIAFLSACKEQEHLLAALSGSVLAAVAAMDFTAGLRHCAILVLVYAVFAAFRDTKYIRREWFRPLTAVGMTAVVELAYLLQGGVTWPRVGAYLSYLVILGMLAHYLQLLPEHQQENGGDSALAALRRRLELSAAAFRDLYNSFSRGTPPKNDENPAVVFDRAAESACRNCGNCALCWGREYVSTFNALNDATPAMLRRGKSLPEDYPEHFRQQCENLPRFLGAVNQELTALLLRRQYRRRLDAERQRARGQYAQLSEFLTYSAQQPAQPAWSANNGGAVRVGGAYRPKEGETVCGDTIVHFESEGRVYLLISDGMGSGPEAQRESANAAGLLEQFLRAGVEAEAALKTINAALTLRSEENGAFTTLDLLALDRASREAVLYKYGAAPTYIKRHGSVRRLTGSALPAGLQDAHTLPPPIRFPVDPGTFILLVSDGVAGEKGDDWLQNTLAGWQGEDPQRLVSLLMGESRSHGGLQDDSSMLCLYLPPTAREV